MGVSVSLSVYVFVHELVYVHVCMCMCHENDKSVMSRNQIKGMFGTSNQNDTHVKMASQGFEKWGGVYDLLVAHASSPQVHVFVSVLVYVFVSVYVSVSVSVCCVYVAGTTQSNYHMHLHRHTIHLLLEIITTQTSTRSLLKQFALALRGSYFLGL